MLESVTDAFYALDRDWRFLYVNRKAAVFLEAEEAEDEQSLVGKILWEVAPGLLGTRLESEFRRALREGVTVAFESSLEKDRIHEVRAYPSAVGLSVYFTDLSERRKLQALAGQATDLKRSNVELERFAYVVAHDLQEPLRTIDGFAKLLVRKHGVEGGEEAEFAAFITSGVDRMHALLRDLLAYSKVDVDRRQAWIDVDCSQALRDALGDLQAMVQASGARIIATEMPTVKGHRTQLTQVFSNLVGNAIKFSGDRAPEIDLAVEDRDVHWLFSVRDRGIGIPSADLDKIFLLFQRLHTSEAYPGTGLGLAISKRIVEHHGGRMWAESEVGRGSAFFFTLPR
jgi:light-regulated signal transduction histidine kinase (bacteriophytochrome)